MKKTRNQLVTSNGCRNNEPLPFILMFNDYFERRFYRKHLEPLGLYTYDMMILCMLYEYRNAAGLVHMRTMERTFKHLWKGSIKTKQWYDALVGIGYIIIEGKYVRLSEKAIKLVLTYNAFVIELVDRKYSMFFRERRSK